MNLAWFVQEGIVVLKQGRAITRTLASKCKHTIVQYIIVCWGRNFYVFPLNMMPETDSLTLLKVFMELSNRLYLVC